MAKPYESLLLTILGEMSAVFDRADEGLIARFASEVDAAKSVVVHSAGRTGLVMRGLVMRLHHLGLAAHVVGDMTTPPVEGGDLLVVNASTGDLPSGIAHLQVARRAGARTLVITASASGPALDLADSVVTLPAQTMLDDMNARTPSVLPMGSQYELALFLLCEMAVLEVSQRRGISFLEMRSRHANLL